MRLFRTTTAVVTSALLVGVAFTAPAGAQTAKGVGTALTSTKALVAQLGDGGSILDVTLLADEARATTDPGVAPSEAFSRVTALSTKTSVSPASAVNQTLGVFEAKNTGPTAVDLKLPTLPAVLAPVVSGDLAGGLTADLKSGVASSAMTAELSKLNTVGGLISIGSVKSNLGTISAADNAAGTRSATVDDITVLKLGALLQGLGIPLDTLSVNQVIALIDGLAASTGLGLPSGSATLATAVAALQAAITDLQGAVAGAPATVGAVTSAVDTTTTTLLGIVGIPAPISTASTVVQATTIVNTVVNQVQAQIDSLLSNGLKALADLSLLRLEGVEVAVSTKAVSTVAGSAAVVTAKIGKVKVGNIELGGLDLAGTTDTVNATVAAVTKKISDTLTLVSPDLAGVVKISAFDKVTSVTQSNGYVRSRAGITAASVTLTPPANIAAIVAGLLAQAGTLRSTLAVVPALSPVMDQLASTLNLGTAALRSPASFQIASVLSASDFASVSGGTTTSGGVPADPNSTLPRTGGTPGNGGLVLLAGFAGVLALVARRWMRHPAVQAVRIDDK
jgi:hypothetical protein